MRFTSTAVLALLTVSVGTNVSAQQAKPPAPREVAKEVRVHKSGGAIRFALLAERPQATKEPNLQGDELRRGQVFLASAPLFLTYDRFNPLSVRVKASVKAVDSPTKDLLAKLVAALGALPGLVGAEDPKHAAESFEKSLGLDAARNSEVPAATAPPCERLPALLSTHLTQLKNILYQPGYSADGLRKQFVAWKDSIDRALTSTSNGSQAIDQGVSAIRTDRAGVDSAISSAKSEVDAINQILAGRDYAQCGWHLAVTGQILTTYQLRIGQLAQLSSALSSLMQTLKTQFGDATGWIGSAMIVATDIEATNVTDAEVTVEVADLDATIEEAVLAIKDGTPVAATFVVRQKVGWTIEASVGAVFGYVRRPQYGTGTNPVTGETIVEMAKNEKALLTPTLMMNFMPQNKAGAVPIIQLGVATTPASPALFLGAGWRVPGIDPQPIAFSLGAVFGWIKALDGLALNDPISGTAELAKHLKFDPIPRVGFYLGIQYKIGG